MVKVRKNRKVEKWFITMMMLVVMFATVGCPDDSGYKVNINNLPTVGDINLTATIEDKMAVKLAWKPLADADEYRIYRDEMYLDKVAYTGKSYYYDCVDFGEFTDGQTYEYCIVARSNKDNVMSKSKSVKIKAEFDPQGTLVADLKDVTTCLIDNEYFVSFSKPDYLDVKVTIGSQISGTEGYTDDLFEEFSTEMTTVIDGKTYKVAVPPVAGTFEYRITTSYATGYYASKVVKNTVTVPSAGETLPSINLSDYWSTKYPLSTDDGVMVAFNDTVGATYTLYRAEQNGDAVQAFTKLNSTAIKCNPNTSSNPTYNTYFLDTTAVLGKTYCYFLAGTLNGKALEFNEEAVATDVTYSNNNWYSNIGFAAYNNYGSDATVDLSWTYDDSITYTLTRCLYDDNSNKPVVDANGTHTEKTIDISGAKLTDGLMVMKDNIDKSEYNTCYKYTLTIKKGDKEYQISQAVTYCYSWNPDFAAYNNNDGTVDLSWTYDSAIAYSLTRCLYNSTTSKPVAGTETTIDISGVTPINGVLVIKDKITRSEYGTKYKYTLTGTKGDSEKTKTQTVTYQKESPTLPTFYISSINAYNDGTADLTITASKSVDMTKGVTCFRATVVQVGYWEKDNSSFEKDGDYYTLTSAYTEISLGKDTTSDAWSSDKINHTYKDKTVSKVSGTKYVYMIKYSKEDITKTEVVTIPY